MFKSQMAWIIEQLETTGKVSRNDALRRFISRLGSRINDLNKAGWSIKGYFDKTDKCRDYRYVLTKPIPKKLKLIK